MSKIATELQGARHIDTVLNPEPSTRSITTKLKPLNLESPSIIAIETFEGTPPKPSGVSNTDSGKSPGKNDLQPLNDWAGGDASSLQKEIDGGLDILEEAGNMLTAAPSVSKLAAMRTLESPGLDKLTRKNIDSFDKAVVRVDIEGGVDDTTQLMSLHKGVSDYGMKEYPSPSPFSEEESAKINAVDSKSGFDDDAKKNKEDLMNLIATSDAPAAQSLVSNVATRKGNRRGSFGGRRNSFSKMMDFIVGQPVDSALHAPGLSQTDGQHESIEEARGKAAQRGGGGRRRSWGEALGLVDSPRSSAAKNKAAMEAAQAKAAANAPKPRTIEVKQRERAPSLKEMKEGEKKGRGFRASFRDSFHNFVGVQEFETVAHRPHGNYPPKIIKRLASEAKRYGVESNLPNHVMFLKPNGARNDDEINIFWMAEMEGPAKTIYEKSIILIEIFVSPEYPFKGPTLSYEGHVVEFVAGKNQTDPRELNILVPWTPAMSLIDAVLKVEELLKEQQERIEAEQLSLERKREEKKRIDEEVQRRVQEELEKRGEEGGEGGGGGAGEQVPPSPGIHNPMQEGRGTATEEMPRVSTPPLFSGEAAAEQTPVVRLGKSSALARRGSFRHSLTANQGNAIASGLNIEALLRGDVEQFDDEELSALDVV